MEKFSENFTGKIKNHDMFGHEVKINYKRQ